MVPAYQCNVEPSQDRNLNKITHDISEFQQILKRKAYETHEIVHAVQRIENYFKFIYSQVEHGVDSADNFTTMNRPTEQLNNMPCKLSGLKSIYLFSNFNEASLRTKAHTWLPIYLRLTPLYLVPFSKYSHNIPNTLNISEIIFLPRRTSY